MSLLRSVGMKGFPYFFPFFLFSCSGGVDSVLPENGFDFSQVSVVVSGGSYERLSRSLDIEVKEIEGEIAYMVKKAEEIVATGSIGMGVVRRISFAFPPGDYTLVTTFSSGDTVLDVSRSFPVGYLEDKVLLVNDLTAAYPSFVRTSLQLLIEGSVASFDTFKLGEKYFVLFPSVIDREKLGRYRNSVPEIVLIGGYVSPKGLAAIIANF